LHTGNSVQDLWLDDRSRVSREVHARLCVQLRLVCSAGVSPARVRIRSPVAWMAGTRETEYLKPIDKASVRDVSESPGRNESERTGGPESDNPRGPSPQPWGEGSMIS